MKIPKEFYIKGKLWRVEYKWRLHDPEHGLCNGLCDFDARTIYIDRLIPKEDKAGVFLHEYIHAVLHEAHLHESGGIAGIIEEVVCASISEAFTSNFNLKWKTK